MKKFLLLFSLSVTLLVANSYQSALERGSKEGKYVLFMVTTQSCPWCNKQKSDILPLEEVKKLIGDFVFVELDKNLDEYPDSIYTRFVPSFYLVDPKNGDVINERYGFQPRGKFIEFLNESLSMIGRR